MNAPTLFEQVVKKSQRERLEDGLLGEIRFYSLPEPVRQFQFAAPDRKWKADFAWPDRKILVEVQGGLYIAGGHNRGAQMENQYEKMNEAQKRGYRIFLFGPKALRCPKHESSLALAFLYDLLRPKMNTTEADKIRLDALEEFKMAVKLCMRSRGEIAFLSEHLPGGVFYQETLEQLRIAKEVR